MDLESIKVYTEITKPFIEAAVQTLVTPQLKRIGAWLKKQDTERKVDNLLWENKFSTYLENLHQSTSYISTLVFPNQQIQIKEIYIPLTIICRKDYSRFVINEFDYNIFSKYKRLIISDTAGMGKSTLTKKITISLIEQSKSIPVLIELRKIDNNNSLLDEIFTQLGSISKEVDKDLVLKLLELGFFTILLDGFDEIPYDIQENVTNQIRSFINNASKNNYILTSRPESALVSFGDFQMFYIEHLSQRSAYELLKKLDVISSEKISHKLINEIKSKASQVNEFLSNPFLVSLLYKSYSYNKDIPTKKSTFYEEVYAALYKYHDLSKDGFKRSKFSGLDILDFRVILRSIAFETAKIGKVIYEKPEFIKHISNAKANNSRIEFKEQNFLDDLITTVPLFNLEGNKVKWAHKSIQDFFAAEYISNNLRKSEMISKIFTSNKYRYLNILDLLYELEPYLFRKLILKSIIEDFIKYHETSYRNIKDVTEKDIIERIGLTFSKTFGFYRVLTEGPDGFMLVRKLFNEALNYPEDSEPDLIFFHDGRCHVLKSSSLTEEILYLLSIKMQELFIERNTSSTELRAQNFKAFKLNKLTILDDNPLATFNKKVHFKKINDVLRVAFQHRSHHISILDLQKCKHELRKINKEISLQTNIDELDGI